MANSIIIRKSAGNTLTIRASNSFTTLGGVSSPATTATIGGVIVGTGLTVQANGLLTANGTANLPYANITGKPTLATVATSGSYNDLSSTPNLTLYLTTANASSTYATQSTTISNGTGLTGGGSLAANRTIAIDSTVVTLTGMQTLTNKTLGATSVNGTMSFLGNITSQVQLQSWRETFASPTISSGNLTLDLSASNFFKVSLNAAITAITITNTPASSAASFTLEFTADGTARSVTWPTAVKWTGGTAPTLTSTSTKTDTFVFYSTDTGTTWKAFVAGQNQ